MKKQESTGCGEHLIILFLARESHYYIDGSVYKGGKLLLLAYDEEKEKYYQVENGRMDIINPFDVRFGLD